MSQTATVAMSMQPSGGSPVGTSVPVQYTALVPGEVIPITGAATYPIDLAMMPSAGLSGLYVEVLTTDAQNGVVTTPVKIVFTNGYVWLPPGGSMSIAAPALTNGGGVTSLSIVTTANARVRIGACG